MIQFLQLKQHISANFYPLIIIKGNDQWVKSRAIELITNSLDIEYADMNVHQVYGGNIDDLMLTCNTQPFFSAQKIVVVHGLEYGKGNNATRTVDMLNNYVKNSDNSCCLVLMSDNSKTLDKVVGEVVDCSKLSDKDVAQWIIATASSKGRTIDHKTATMVSQYCIADMARVASETEKLCAHSSGDIDANMVELLVTKDTEYQVFDLAKVIANKNTALALDMLSKLMRQGNDARSLFALMYNYYRRMYYVKITKSDRDTLASQLGVKSGAISFAKVVADKYKPKQLLRAIELFANADSKIKKFVNEQDTMQLLVLELVAL